jgi:hypothetical protein
MVDHLGEICQLDAALADAGFADSVRKLQDRIGIGKIEGVAVENQEVYLAPISR